MLLCLSNWSDSIFLSVSCFYLIVPFNSSISILWEAIRRAAGGGRDQMNWAGGGNPPPGTRTLGFRLPADTGRTQAPGRSYWRDMASSVSSQLSLADRLFRDIFFEIYIYLIFQLFIFSNYYLPKPANVITTDNFDGATRPKPFKTSHA